MTHFDLPYSPQDLDLPEDLAERPITGTIGLPRLPVPPHCDADVLHAPGECRFCDRRPDLQIYRLRAAVAFTGHPAPDNGFPCPSDARRGLAGAHVWGGNRPSG